MTDIKEYGEWTDDEVKADIQYAARLKRKKALLEVGNNVWRFLPPLPGQRPFYVAQKHYIDKISEKGSVVIDNCPRVTADARCPICEHAAKLLASGNPYDAKAADRLEPVPRVYWCGVNIGSGLPPSELKPEIIELPFGVHKKLLLLRDDENFGDFTHPDTGFDVSISRVGTGFDTSYGDPQSSLGGRKPIENRAWLSQLKSFASCAQLPSRETMTEAMSILTGQASPSGALPMQNVTPPAGYMDAPAPQQQAQGVAPMAPPPAQPAPAGLPQSEFMCSDCLKAVPTMDAPCPHCQSVRTVFTAVVRAAMAKSAPVPGSTVQDDIEY